MKTEKVEKFLANLHDIKEYVIHIRHVKQALNHRVGLKNVFRVIKFNRESWLKPYFNLDTESRKKQKTACSF